MKTILLLLAASLTAAAASPSQLKISAPHYPGATVRIVTHGCEGMTLVSNHALIVPENYVRLDDHGKAITRLLANDSEVRCNYPWPRPTSYGVQIMGSDHKEKIVKIRAGKTTRIKL